EPPGTARQAGAICDAGAGSSGLTSHPLSDVAATTCASRRSTATTSGRAGPCGRAARGANVRVGRNERPREADQMARRRWGWAMGLGLAAAGGCGLLGDYHFGDYQLTGGGSTATMTSSSSSSSTSSSSGSSSTSSSSGSSSTSGSSSSSSSSGTVA